MCAPTPARAVLLAALLAAACNPSSGATSVTVTPPPSPDASSDAQGPEPEEIPLPGGYEPAIECGDLGMRCANDGECGADQRCENVCIPSRVVDPERSCVPGSCPPEAPTCLVGICVTRDELACVCQSTQARRIYPLCGDTDRADLSCTPLNGLCDGDTAPCCGERSCLQGSGLLGICQEACEQDGDCPTGCCAEDSEVGGKFCAANEFCQLTCAMEGQDCSTEGARCCEGLICSESSLAALDGCRPRCELPADCDTGCCRLFTEQNFGVCAAADQCP